MHIHMSLLFWISFPSRSSQSTSSTSSTHRVSSLSDTAGSHQLSILNIVVEICQSQSPSLSHSPLSPWCPYVSSLCLCLYFCFANKIIYIIFPNSTKPEKFNDYVPLEIQFHFIVFSLKVWLQDNFFFS